MKKITLCMAVLFILSGVGYADQWCEWSGTEGINCVSDVKPGIPFGILVSPTGTPTRVDTNIDLIHSWGLYRLEITRPVLGESQTLDTEVWSLYTHPINEDKIKKTWTVRDMTATEIDARDSGPMPLSEYYLWKALIVKGVITQQEAASALPQELIDAYLARDRIINP